jgi:2-oxoglutarate ferredoxin oxidoreductase subunit gamma
VDDKGLITEIIDGTFVDDPKPDFQAAIEKMAQIAKKQWVVTKKALDERPQLPKRTDHLPRTEIQLGGFGGQGIMSAGNIIGQAATIYDGLEASLTQSYGPEARGGAAGSQVVIASDPIHHPHLVDPTSMIIMSQEAYSKYVIDLSTGGVLLIDNGLVKLPAETRGDIAIFGLPATQIAEEFGNVRSANAVMLGLWTAIIGAVSKPAMRQSLTDSVPPKTIEVNLKSFETGYEKGLKLKNSE